MRQEAAGWEGHRGELQSTLASLNSDLFSLKAKHIAVLQNTEAIEVKNHTLLQRVTELEAELEAIEGDNDVLLAQAGALQDRADAASKVADAVGADAASRAAALEADNTALRDVTESLRMALAAAEEESGRRGAAVAHLEGEVARMQAALDAAADTAPQTSFFLTTTAASAPTQAQTAVVITKGLHVVADRSVDAKDSTAQAEASCCAICQAAGTGAGAGGSPFDQFVSLKKENRTLKLQLAVAVAQGKGARQKG